MTTTNELADGLAEISGRCSNERDRETIIKAVSALRRRDADGGAAGAWRVDGPRPLDRSEVFLSHATAVEAFSDWGKCITPLYAHPAPIEHPGVREALTDLTGAIRFVLAFYEPGQRYLDTNAWKNAEAGKRAAFARAEVARAANSDGA